MRFGRLNLFLIITLFGVIAALGYQNQQLKNEVAFTRVTQYWPRVGGTVPSMTVKALDGTSISLGQPLQSTQQVLFFFSSGCAACIRSMPFMKEVAASFARHDVELIGITPEPDSAQLRKFIQGHALEYPVVAGLLPREIKALNFRMTPTTVVVDSKGDISYVKVGSIESNKDAFDLVVGALGKEVQSPKIGGAK